MNETEILTKFRDTLSWIEDRLQRGGFRYQDKSHNVGEELRHITEQGNILLGRTGTKSGTLKSWMQAHDRTSVDTLQLQLSHKEVPYGAWAPVDRTVNAHERASGVYLTTDPNPGTWSLRDYAGARVILSSPDAILVCTGWQAVLYVASSGVHS